MNIDIYDMQEEYVCSGLIESEFQVDFEKVCNAVIERKIFDAIIRYNPDLEDVVEEIHVEWMYSGYHVFVFGIHLKEDQVRKFLDTIDDVNTIGFCELFWERATEKRNYTGVSIAYDNKHFHRVRQDEHSFVVFSYNSLREFMESFNIRYNFEDPRVTAVLHRIQFRHDKLREKEIVKEKMRGIYVMPKLDMNRNKLLQIESKMTGKMRTSMLGGENQYIHFDSYWDKKNKG